MMTAGCFLRGSLFALLVVATCGYPQKGSPSTGHSSSGDSTGANYASYRGGAPSFPAAPYRAVGSVYGAASAPTYQSSPSGYQPLLAATVMNSPGSSAALGVQGAGVGALGVQDAGVATGGQMGALVSGPVGAGYMAGPLLYEPVAESSAGAQDEPATQWTVPTTVFEAGSADAQDIDDLLPQAPSGPQGPTLQSGEASSVVKEAELGNYQQQTEEFGYPADLAGSGQGFGPGLATVLVPGGEMGGFRPVYPGRFNWMLLYGMLPPGSYSSFSQNHEAGKDYSQAIHYLKEHVAESHGSGQQKKFLPGAQ